MSVRGLSLRDLASVSALARHGSFSEAAERLSITQPALSERIRKVEDALGIRLFERTPRGAVPVVDGVPVIEQVRRVLDAADVIERLAGQERAPLSGEFRLGVIATLGPYLMPYLLGPLKDYHPSLKLILREGLTDELLDALRGGSLDAVLLALPVETPGISKRALFFEPFVLAAPQGHRLATKAHIDRRDLKGEDMLLLEEGHCLSGQALDVCPANRRENARRLQATSLETLRHMIASGAGYTLLPWLAVGENPALDGLIAYRGMSAGPQGRTIGLVWRSSFPRPSDIDELADTVVAALPNGVTTLNEQAR